MAAVPPGGHVHARRFLAAVLQGIADQVLKELCEPHAVGQDVRQGVVGNFRRRFLDARAEILQYGIEHLFRVDQFRLVILRLSGLRILEKIPNQLAHALDGIH